MKKLIGVLAAGALIASSIANADDIVREYAKYRKAVVAARDMFQDTVTNALVAKYGLDLLSVTWEDTGRSKNSALGPNISDMSIQVQVANDKGDLELTSMPVMRYGNFDDKTADISPEKFTVLVGNEKGQQLRAVTLRDYLANFRSYLSNPASWAGSEDSLLSPRDTHVLVSPQISFLPVPTGGIAKFNPALFNYQSYQGNPAVLAIVATREGTSATIIDNTRDAFGEGYAYGQRLFFNENGQRASFTATRVSDFYGPDEKTEEKPMPPADGHEANGRSGMNMVLLIQVPLKHVAPKYHDESKQDNAGSGEDQPQEDAGGVEDAVIGHGDIEGPFTEIDGLKIERDHRFPIRVTVQFYKATDVATLNEEQAKEMKRQLDEVFKGADYVGSLVTEGTTLRPTEHNVKCDYPRWWKQDVWPLEVGGRKMTRAQAEKYVDDEIRRGVYGPWYWCEWFEDPTPRSFRQAVEMVRDGDFKIVD